MLLLPATAVANMEIAEAPPEDPTRVTPPPVRHHAITDLSLRISTTGGEPLESFIAEVEAQARGS